MQQQYNIGDIRKIKFYKEIKYIAIINVQMGISEPGYEYIVQGIEGKTFWDLQSHLVVRELEAINTLLINTLLETAIKHHEI